MTDLYWLEQTIADVPEQNDWLSSGEIRRLKTIRVAKRLADWRLGRWTAKRAVASCLRHPDDSQGLAAVEIEAASTGAPEVFTQFRYPKPAISLSHRSGRAMCAVSFTASELGCDLENIEPRTNAFVSDYFTAEERYLVAHTPDAGRSRLVALLWSAKESALKMLQAGLRLDTRSVSVAPRLSGRDWHRLQVRYNDMIFHGWWQQDGEMLRTFVANPTSNPPIRLQCLPYQNGRTCA